MVLIEHIGSNDALKMPLDELVALVREREPRALILVDAAHTPGTQATLPLADVDDVLLAGNLHKWFYG